jgi:UDP-N-acetylglucosamine--N-acetylmuramyl-(pentapeptide) pyrophosphoryl-undecaprenol N-acetylglucosamine transferase
MAVHTIVCGGTGGHLTPGIAVAERLLERSEVPILVLSRKAVDQRLAAKYGRLRFVSAPGVAPSIRPLRMLGFVWQLLAALHFAHRHLGREQPATLLAFGGYLSFAFVIAARLHGIPVYIHEANRRPGRVVRLCARLARRVYLPDGVRLASAPPPEARSLGMPLRRELVHMPRDVVRREAGLRLHDKVLLVLGGSQGAAVLNKWVDQHAAALAADGIHVICVTGPGQGDGEGLETHLSYLDEEITVRRMPFCSTMASLYSCADLVVSRAGAGTMAELAACACPSILIPYPFAADNHQQANARYLEQRGGCLLLEQNKLADLRGEVKELIFNDWLLARMRENLRRLGGGDCADAIARELVADARAQAAAGNAGKEVAV